MLVGVSALIDKSAKRQKCLTHVVVNFSAAGLGQTRDKGFLRGAELFKCVAGSHFEIGEVKTGGDGAADEGEAVAPVNRCAEPMVSFNTALKCLPAVGVRSKTEGGVAALRGDDVEGQWAAGVEVPEFVGFQPVEPGYVTAPQQEVDGC